MTFALVIGICAGFAALLFRKGIEALQAFLYGTEDTSTLHTAAGFAVVLDPVDSHCDQPE